MSILNEKFVLILCALLFFMWFFIHDYFEAKNKIWLKLHNYYHIKIKGIGKPCLTDWLFCYDLDSLAERKKVKKFYTNAMSFYVLSRGLYMKCGISLFVKPVLVPWSDMKFIEKYSEPYCNKLVKLRLAKIDIDIGVPEDVFDRIKQEKFEVKGLS